MFQLLKSKDPHTAHLDRLVGGWTDGRTLHDLFGQADEEFWFWCFTEGYRSDDRLRALLPAFPPEEVQCRYTGAAGDVTMREAFGFYSLVKRLHQQYGRTPLTAVLDFGCGWGRTIRLFTRDVEPANLRGVDCMAPAIAICKETNRHARFDLIEPFPPTALPNEAFDLVYAYSVFSHLSEQAHLAWLEEFRRVLKPNGLLIVTTRAREFVLDCARIREATDQPFWKAGPAMSFQDTAGALARYDRGEFLYEPVGGGDVLDASFFGETCIPRQYVVERWTRLFEFLSYSDDRADCVQNVITVRKN